MQAIKQQLGRGGHRVRPLRAERHARDQPAPKPCRRAIFRASPRSGLNFLLGHLGFDVQSGVAMGSGYLEDLGFPDSRIFPDLDTLVTVPWADRTASVLCEPRFQDGRPAMAAPRAVARGLLRELESMGYGFFSGFEYEFYLVNRETRQPPFPGIQIFTTLRNNFDPAIVDQILLDMPQVGVDIITSNSEYGPGQMEINFAPASGISAADHAFRFKNGVKEIAQKHGYMASFMTKPYADQSASGCHYHHSLTDLKTGSNAFSNPDNPFELNDTCRWWLGGQIKHAAAICALGCADDQLLQALQAVVVRADQRHLGHGKPHRRRARQRAEGRRRASGKPHARRGVQSLSGHGGDPGGGHRRAAQPDRAARRRSRRSPTAWKASKICPPDCRRRSTRWKPTRALRDLLGEEFIKLYLAVKRHEINKAARTRRGCECRRLPRPG